MTLQERARELYVPGVFGYNRVAAELGVSNTTVRRWVHPDFAERHRQASRAAKRKRTGTCRKCGGETRYNGHPGQPVSDLCRTCSEADLAALAKERFMGKGKTQVRALAALADGPMRFIEIRDALGVSNGHTSQLMHRLLRHGLVVRVKWGVYALPEERP